jgi:N-acetylneuraminic acid mutarotase
VRAASPVDVVRGFSALRSRVDGASRLEARSDAQWLAKVDSGGASLQPSSFSVAVPRQSSGAVRLSREGDENTWLEIRTLGTTGSVAGSIEQGAIAYRGADRDLDVVLSIGASRFEELRVLRTARAPTVARYALDVPAGMQVRLEDGRVEVLDPAGRVAFRTDAAFAVDSNGAQRAVELTLAGKEITESLDPVGLTFPVIVTRALVTPATWPAQAVVAQNSIELGGTIAGDVVVVQRHSGATIGSFAMGQVDANAQVTGSLTADTIRVQPMGVVTVDARFNTFSGTGTVRGKKTTPLTLPVSVTLPAFPSFTAGTTDVTSSSTTTPLQLAPGSYRALNVKQGTTLRPTGGVYTFASVTFGSSARIECLAACTLRFVGRFAGAASTFVGPATTATFNSDGVEVYVSASNGSSSLTATPAVAFGATNTIHARFSAPNGTISAATTGTKIVGTLVARDVLVATGVQVTKDVPTCTANDNNRCTQDTCNAAGQPVFTPLPSGTSCADTTVCNGAEACNGAGVCAAGVALVVDDGNPCTTDACDPTAGVTHKLLASGSSCSDGNVCNGAELCNATGVCGSGTPLVVNDGNPCTTDSCDPKTGVSHVALAVGAQCSDGNTCNGMETCKTGAVCGAGSPPSLDDGNACTKDSCDPALGVLHAPLAAGTSCTDGNACNGVEVCDAAGGCLAGTVPTVDDGNPCTADSCSAQLGVSHVAVANGTSCGDSNVCNGAEICQSGSCTPGTALAVDDGNPCTTDTCDPVAGVKHTAVANGTACPDGNACNGAELCTSGACTAGTPPALDDANPCTADSCDPKTGVKHVPVAIGTSCSDGNACNGSETCSSGGSCVANAPPVVDDGNPCTIDSCSPTSGVTHTAASAGTACDNATICDGREKCDAAGHCQSGTPLAVDDGNSCTTDSCDPTLGAQHSPNVDGSSCSDGNACTQGDTCHAGTCTSGAPVSCASTDPCQGSACNPSTGACTPTVLPTLSDNNPCTADTCDPTTGAIQHQPLSLGIACDDATVCNGREICDGHGACVTGAGPDATDDGNPCTADQCDPVAGPTHQPTPLGSACDDNTVCNGHETCDGNGACSHSTGSPTIVVSNCTNDFCDPVLGVLHTPLPEGSPCPDRNPCNGFERCDGAGQCLPGVPIPVDDGNPCTLDFCDTSFGQVQHFPWPGGRSCDNGNVCDGVSTCDGAGSCTPGVPPVVDDGDACTVDSCDPVSGVSHVRSSANSCALSAGWQTLTPSQPSPRDAAAGVFTDTGELFVFGGENAGASLADAWLWRPAQHGWRRGAPGPSARSGAGIGFDTVRKSVIVFGGVSGADANATYLGDVWEYTAATDTWVPRPAVGPTPANRALAAFAYDSSQQRALLFGGVGPTHLADTWEWTASTGAWAQISTQGPPARFGAAFAFDPAHGVFVLFGGSPQGVSGGALADTWTFNANTGVWSVSAPTTVPPARTGASITFDASVSRLVMVGGTSIDSLNLSDVWQFDADAGNWSQLTANPAPVGVGAVAGFDPVANQVLISGGVGYSNSGEFTTDSGLVWSYSRATQLWTTRTAISGPAQLDLGAAFDTSTGRIIARATVERNDTSTRPMMWAYDGLTGTWSSTDATAGQTDFGSGAFKGSPIGNNWLVYDAGRKRAIRLSGNAPGDFAPGDLNLSEWDGSQWTRSCDFPATASLDVTVSNPSVVFDPPRERVLVFGSGKLVAIDPAGCTATLLPQGNQLPAGRTLSTLAWDSDRDVFVLFGGNTSVLQGGTEFLDTWEFDPRAGTWAQISTSGGPSARHSATMAYDPQRKKMVLYGGITDGPTIFRDTWEYTAQQGWSERSAGGGPGSGKAAIVFDSVRSQATLVGSDGSVWVWNGATWIADGNSASPSARSGMSGGWVASHEAGFFFGGTSGDGRRTFLSDLWMWNGSWHLLSQPGPNPSPLLWGDWGDNAGQFPTTAGPPARTGHVLATGHLGVHELALLFGGEGDSGLLGDTWSLDDTTLQWTFQDVFPAPDPRTGHAMSLFPGLGYVLFGGLTRPTGGQDTLVNDTWLWSPGWSEINSSTAPTPRFGHAMATDPIAKQIILFGGRDATGVVGDTWLLDLNTLQSIGWQKLSPANSPLPRFGHSMTFDTLRNRIVLAGGEGATANQVFGDTWEWDGTNRSWVRRNIVAFDGRAGHAAFFDEGAEQTILFGGFAHDPTGGFAQSRDDTLAFVNASQTDPVIGHPNGDKCTANSDCGSGICVDGVCCNSSCAGQCAACDVPGSQGTCIAVNGTPHGGRASCSGPTGACGSMCNGSDTTACHVVPTGVTCGPAPGCAAGLFVQNQGACDGLGTCAQNVTSCAPYACGTPPDFATTGCLTKCDGDANCFSSDYACYRPDLNRLCYLKDKITSFTVTPTVLTVGTTVTMTVQGSIPNSLYGFSFFNAAQTTNGNVCDSESTKTTCTFKLGPVDVGVGTFRVTAHSPQIFSGLDDTKSVDIAIGAQQ